MKNTFVKIVKSILIFVLITLSSCKYGSGNIFYEYNSVDSRIEQLTKINPGFETLGTGSNINYSFLLITDIHFGSARPDREELPLEKFWNWMDKQNTDGTMPDFCLVLGDSIDWSDDAKFADYVTFRDRIENQYGLKVFNVIGNHDMYQMGWEMWKDNNYPNTSFYKFETNDYSLYALDSASGTFGQKQIELLKQDFQHDSKPKMIFTHYPLYTNKFYVSLDDTTERNNLITLFNQNNVKAYFNGHIHRKEETNLGLFTDYSVPSFMFTQKWTVVSVNGLTHELSLKYCKQ